MCPVHDVGDKLRPEWQSDLAAIDIPDLLLVDDKQVIAAGLSSDIDILTQLNVSACSKNEEPPITPGAETIRSEPIHPDISSTTVAMHHHVAKVLKLRVIWMVHIGDLRRGHLSSSRVGVVNKLV